jgi:hypothetical protein
MFTSKTKSFSFFSSTQIPSAWQARALMPGSCMSLGRLTPSLTHVSAYTLSFHFVGNIVRCRDRFIHTKRDEKREEAPVFDQSFDQAVITKITRRLNYSYYRYEYPYPILNTFEHILLALVCCLLLGQLRSVLLCQRQSGLPVFFNSLDPRKFPAPRRPTDSVGWSNKHENKYKKGEKLRKRVPVGLELGFHALPKLRRDAR